MYSGVNDYIAKTAERKWEIGQMDCATWVADWISFHRAIDPLSMWRGKYKNNVEIAKILRNGNGYFNLMARRMELLGFPETLTPRAGDVGMVKAMVRKDPAFIGTVPAIHNGQFWVVRLWSGVMGADFPLLRAWRVSTCHLS